MNINFISLCNVGSVHVHWEEGVTTRNQVVIGLLKPDVSVVLV